MIEPRRCIHLLDTDGFAGTERHVLDLVTGLRRLPVEVWIGCLGGSQLRHAAESAGLPVLNLGDRPGLPMLRPLLRHIKRLRVDAVHSHNGRTQLVGAIARSLSGVDLFSTQHFIDPKFTTYTGFKRLAANAAHAWVNRRVRSFVSVSEAAAAKMIVREKIDPARIATICNGIEPPIRPSAEKVARLKSELGIPPGVPVVCTVARLATEKGHSALIDAIPSILASVPNCHFLMVGDGPLRRSLESRVHKLNVESRTHFLGFRNDATDFIAVSDVFVLPSPAEPFGLVLLEAMALAKPVVAVAAGGPLEIVLDHVTGRLAPMSSAVDLAAALVHLLTSPDQAAIGRAAYERFVDRFTADRMATEVAAVYRDVEKGSARLGRRARSAIA